MEGRYISECKELLDLVLHLLINFNNEANAIRAYNSSFMRDGTFVAITIEFTNLSREFIAFRGANFEPDNEPRMNTDLPQVIEDLKNMRTRIVALNQELLNFIHQHNINVSPNITRNNSDATIGGTIKKKTKKTKL